jgi:hypothetical protein
MTDTVTLYPAPAGIAAIKNLTIAGRRVDSSSAMDLETNAHVLNLRIAGTAQ